PHCWKLCFPYGRKSRETEFPREGSQTEFGNQDRKQQSSTCERSYTNAHFHQSRFLTGNRFPYRGFEICIVRHGPGTNAKRTREQTKIGVAEIHTDESVLIASALNRLDQG